MSESLIDRLPLRSRSLIDSFDDSDMVVIQDSRFGTLEAIMTTNMSAQKQAIPDDEFEDFPTEGTHSLINTDIDWPDSDASLGQNKKEWEDSWDDDDVQDDFSKQLKAELEKTDENAMKN